MQMKLNKSILGSALIIVFLFSACSQAKYGNLTRRVKTNHTVQKAEKPIKVEEEQKQTIVKVETTTSAKNDEIAKVLVSDESSVETIATKELNTETARIIEPKGNTTNSTIKTVAKGKVGKVLEKTAISKVNKQIKQLKVDQSNSDSSLIRLILIIILVLLILSLISRLIPGLDWLLGILLLIVLIWLILQLL